MPDIEIPCVQCGENFAFTEKEQETFYQHNMPQPQRCQKCRSKKAANVGGVNVGGRFQIVCDHCGKHDHVPFQPKTGRSVLCKDCHQANRSKVRFA